MLRVLFNTTKQLSIDEQYSDAFRKLMLRILI